MCNTVLKKSQGRGGDSRLRPKRTKYEEEKQWGEGHLNVGTTAVLRISIILIRIRIQDVKNSSGYRPNDYTDLDPDRGQKLCRSGSRSRQKRKKYQENQTNLIKMHIFHVLCVYIT